MKVWFPGNVHFLKKRMVSISYPNILDAPKALLMYEKFKISSVVSAECNLSYPGLPPVRFWSVPSGWQTRPQTGL